MTYALKGSTFQAAMQSRSTAGSKQPTRLPHAIVKVQLTPVQAATEAREAVGKLVTSLSAAALLLVRVAPFGGKDTPGSYKSRLAKSLVAGVACQCSCRTKPVSGKYDVSAGAARSY